MNEEAGNKIVEGLHKLWETSLLQNVKANPEWATNEIQNQYAIRMKYEIEIGELKEKNKKIKIKNKNLQSKIDKAIEYCEYNNESLYTFEPDYDYEENIVDNYEPSNFREDIMEILKEDK